MCNINDFVIENGVLIKYTGSDSELVIPDIVQVIGNNALASCNTLQTVIVSEGIIKIEDYGDCHYNSVIDCVGNCTRQS